MQKQAITGVYDVREFGAAGDGETLDTAAIQQAIDACTEAGGGRVFVPPGIYVTGTIFLKSRVNLHLAAGATLRGSTRREDYNPDDIFPENPFSTREQATGAHLVIAYKAEQISITGQGTIDGNSAAFFETLPPDEVTTTYRNKSRNFPIAEWRPGQMVLLCRCTDVSVRDVTLINSPYWTLLLLGCTGARIRGLSITNPPQTPNGDGIDIDCCQDVTVSDCIITSGDDSITLRGNSRLLGERAQPCENVTVSNCVLSTPCNAVRVGVGDGEIRNCALSNLVIKQSRNGISFNSAYSERSAHGTRIENVHFANIVMDVILPLNMVLGVHAKPPGMIRNISLTNLHVSAREGFHICGNPGHRIEDIRLKDVRVAPGGDDVDPDFTGDAPRTAGLMHVPAALYAREVSGLRLSDFQVRWGEVGSSWRSAIEIEDSDEVVLTQLDAEAPPSTPKAETLRTSGVEGLMVSRLAEA
ncbi:MAG: glycoside hydrolase family 28 protein [Armatimonadota bacterium]